MRAKAYSGCAVMILLSGATASAAASLGCSDQQSDCSNNASCSPFDGGGGSAGKGGTSGGGGSLGSGGTGGGGDAGAGGSKESVRFSV